METSDLLYLTSDLVPKTCYKRVKQIISHGISLKHHTICFEWYNVSKIYNNDIIFNIILKSDVLRALNIFNDNNLIIKFKI